MELKQETSDDLYELDNSRIQDQADNTNSALADLGLILPETHPISLERPDEAHRKGDADLSSEQNMGALPYNAAQGGNVFDCRNNYMFDQKLNDFPPSMVGELPRQMLANEYLTMNGQGFGNEKVTLETTQKTCFEEQMMRQLWKLVKQGDLLEHEKAVLGQALEKGEQVDYETMSNHLKTYHSIKQKPEKFDLAVCEQLLNNFRVTIDHAWEMMSEKERSDYSKSTTDLEEDIRREELKRNRKPRGPKRPSAYNLYMRDHKEAVRQANPNWTPSEVNKRLGIEWKHASIDVKNTYKKRALNATEGRSNSPIQIDS